MSLRGRSRAARPSPRVDRTRPAATPALDGWPSPRPPRGDRATKSGVQPDSSAAQAAAPRLAGQRPFLTEPRASAGCRSAAGAAGRPVRVPEASGVCRSRGRASVWPWGRVRVRSRPRCGGTGRAVLPRGSPRSRAVPTGGRSTAGSPGAPRGSDAMPSGRRRSRGVRRGAARSSRHGARPIGRAVRRPCPERSGPGDPVLPAQGGRPYPRWCAGCVRWRDDGHRPGVRPGEVPGAAS